MKSFLVLALAVGLAALSHGGNTIYGLKSKATTGSASIPPTRLFSFDGTTGVVNDIGWLTYNGGQVDADGLAHDGATLYGFVLEQGGSRLVSIDTATAVASSLAFYQGTSMRGATFRNGKLYTLDVVPGTAWNVATIDLGTLALNSVALNTTIADGCDLDFDAQGTLWVAEANAFHTLDPLTGALTFVSADGVPEPQNPPFFAGFVFDETSPARSLVYDVNTNDDLYTYTMPSPTRTMLTPDILNSFNAGRGDLAAVPEPASIIAVGVGLAALLRRRRGYRRPD